jgi:hypothetical protein
MIIISLTKANSIKEGTVCCYSTLGYKIMRIISQSRVKQNMPTAIISVQIMKTIILAAKMGIVVL